MKNKAVIYSRVSTEQQTGESHYSLAAQRRVCNKYAKTNGLEVIDMFEDAGKSGTTIVGRPALRQMLAFIEENKDAVSTVLVQDTDRIARNTEHHLAIKAQLSSNEVQLISVNQPQLSDGSAEGKAMDTIVAAFNTLQSDITARKVKKGMKQKALSGWSPTEAPIGYRNYTKSNDKKIIVQDKDKAPFIKKAFDMYASGKYSIAEINEIIYKQGFRTKLEKKMEIGKLFYIIQNPYYYGTFIWNGEKYPGKHKPIVSKELFDLVQAMRESRSLHNSYQRHHKFLLTSFLFCPCGRKFTASIHRGRYSYYHCTKGKKCGNKTVPIKTLEEQVEERFKEVTFTKDFKDKLIIALKKKYDNFKQEVEEAANHLIKQKSAIENRRDRMERMLFDKELELEVYNRNKAKFKEELSVINAELSSLQNKKNIEVGSFEEVLDFCLNVYDAYKKSNYEVKRRYLGFFWEKFTVENMQIVNAEPTPLFQAIQAIQKPLETGAFAGMLQKFDSIPVSAGEFLNSPIRSG